MKCRGNKCPGNLWLSSPRLSPSLRRVSLVAGDGSLRPAPSAPASPSCFRLSSDKPFYLFIFQSFTATASRSGLAPVPEPQPRGVPAPRSPQRPQEPTAAAPLGRPLPPRALSAPHRGCPRSTGHFELGTWPSGPGTTPPTRSVCGGPGAAPSPPARSRRLRAGRASGGGKNPSAPPSRFTSVLLSV